MTPSRRNSNGRSPLVNPQRQITSFFSKSTPSPTLSKTNQKLNPNPIPDPNPSPTTPSPIVPKPHKPVLLIGASSSPSLFGEEVVGRRIKVYWPLDKAWYEGYVKSFDKVTSKHLVRYDDDEEESIDLSKEKIEWPQDTSLKKLKRLRRGFPAIRKMVIEEDDEVEETRKESNNDDDGDGDGDDDDSNDEDWGKNGVAEDAGDGEDEDTELEEEDDVAERAKGKPSKKVQPRKRKLGGAEKVEPVKKSKSGVEVGKGGFKFSVLEPASNLDIIKTPAVDNVAAGDASERFAPREAQKLRFLRE